MCKNNTVRRSSTLCLLFSHDINPTLPPSRPPPQLMTVDPPKAIGTSSAPIALVPRQIMLAMSAGCVPEKVKDKKKMKKKGTGSAGDAEERGMDLKRCGGLAKEGRDVLVRAIAAFLEANGFSRTLAIFKSEANLELDSVSESLLDLEDILSKFMESRKSSSEDNGDHHKGQDGEANGHGGAKPDLICSKDWLNRESKEYTNTPLLSEADRALMGGKRKKRKNKAESTTEKSKVPLGLDHENNRNLDQENQLKESHEEPNTKKNKKSNLSVNATDDKVAEAGSKNLREIVEEKLEDLKSVIQNKASQSDEVEMKPQDKKKKKKKLNSDTSAGLQIGVETAEEMPKAKSKSLISQHTAKNAHADNELSDPEFKSKDKKKKQKSASEDSHTENTENVGGSVDNDKKREGKQISEEAFDDKKGRKSKRKRSASDGEGANLNTEGLVEKNEKEQRLDDSVTCNGNANHGNKKRKTETGKEDLNKSLTESKEKLNESNGIKETKQQQKNGGSDSAKTMDAGENQSAEPKTVKAFQRVKIDEVKFADERLQDNSYWAKDGADSGYGAKAQEVFGQVRGRDFRHEKTKKKRGTYRGGQIDLQSHSIKFNYSDEE